MVQLLPVPTLPCIDTVVTIQSQTNAGTNLQYAWSSPNGTILSDPTSPEVYTSSTGTYSLLVTNPINGCTTLVTTQVIADQVVPVVQLIDPGILTCLLTGQWLTELSRIPGGS